MISHAYDLYGTQSERWGNKEFFTKVYCDRADEDEIAVYIEHMNKYYVFSMNLTLAGVNKKINFERYLAIFLAEKIGAKACEIYINGIEPLETDLIEELNKRFVAAKVIVIGKNLCNFTGFRVTSELLYLLVHRKFYTPAPIQLSLEDKMEIGVNEVINSLYKPRIQHIGFLFIEDDYHSPVSKFTPAFLWFEFRFFISSFDVLKIQLTPHETAYIPYEVIEKKITEENENIIIKEVIELEINEDELDFMENFTDNKKFLDDLDDLLNQ